MTDSKQTVSLEEAPMRFDFVCANTDCHPSIPRGRMRVIAEMDPHYQRSYYHLPPEQCERWRRGTHPGCPRCGSHLEKVK